MYETCDCALLCGELSCVICDYRKINYKSIPYTISVLILFNREETIFFILGNLRVNYTYVRVFKQELI